MCMQVCVLSRVEQTNLAMFPAAATMVFWDMAATRLIPWPSAPRSYTYSKTDRQILKHKHTFAVFTAETVHCSLVTDVIELNL